MRKATERTAPLRDAVTLQRVSFDLRDVATLRKPLAFLKERGVEVEDPGDEIGPEAPGSPNVSIWLRDLDGYHLEFSVQGGAKEL